jgi:cyanuric acid amidohydrolase
MQVAGISDPLDVHFVQVKCPLLITERIAAAKLRGQNTVTINTYESMAFSRGASSLGIGLALGELAAPVDEAQVLHDWTQFSSVASASSGVELAHNVIIVMGNSAFSTGLYRIGHAVMRDSIDLQAINAAFESAGTSRGAPNDRLVNVFAKAEASPNGSIRGFRHTMLEDSDINSTRHARAAVGGLIGGFAATGGSPVAVIVRV